MENDVAWLREFYKEITTHKHELPKLISILGDIDKTNVVGNIKNYFISPKENRFKSIYIACDNSNDVIKQIGFIGESFKLPFLECKHYTLNYKKQFIIYDEKVEFIFLVKLNNGGLKNIVCFTDESALDFAEDGDQKLIFNNIYFTF